MKKRTKIILGIVLMLLAVILTFGPTALALRANQQDSYLPGSLGFLCTPNGNAWVCDCPPDADIPCYCHLIGYGGRI